MPQTDTEARFIRLVQFGKPNISWEVAGPALAELRALDTLRGLPEHQ